jgi:SAM-dependent methyltransferase
LKGRLQERAERTSSEVPLGGPPDDFERVGRMQLETLIHEGLYCDSKVLDVGCGSLRAGYWLIHFLEEANYYGIEPYTEMLQNGLDNILEPGVAEAKKPTFDHNREFDFTVFGVEFDFLLARSIWTHADMAEIEQMLDGFVKVASPEGVFLTSYFRFPPPPADSPHFFASMILSRQEAIYEKYPAVKELVQERLGLRYGVHKAARVGDADEKILPNKMIAHTLQEIRAACRRRGLKVRELSYNVANSQRWLRIERA